jgi:hypothetical protein
MSSIYYCKMTLDRHTIIDGKNDKRKQLAEFQADSYAAASEILIGLSKQISEMGFEIVPVTINDGGIPRAALALAPMSLEQYIAFSKNLHAQSDTAKAATQEEGSKLSE